MSELLHSTSLIQLLVLQYERGEIDLKSLQNQLPPLVSGTTWSDLLNAAVGVYGYIRPRESVAYRYRNGPMSDYNEISLWIKEAYLLEEEIERRLVEVEQLETNSLLEEAGKMFVEEKLNWAKIILDESLPTWGFPKGDSP